MLLPLALMLQNAAAAPAGTAAPIALFKQACVAGSFTAKQGQLKPIHYADLPAEARSLFSRAASGEVHDEFRERTASEVANPVYSLDGGKAFLITATPAPDAGSDLAEVCAVIWRGDDFVAAERSLAVPETANPSTPPSGMSDDALKAKHYSFAATDDGDSYLVAVGSKHWTALTSAPSAAGRNRTPRKQ